MNNKLIGVFDVIADNYKHYHGTSQLYHGLLWVYGLYLR